MNLGRRVAEWRAANVITAETAEAILAHERGRRRGPILLWAVSGLGAIAVAVGAMAIVASNWDGIPPSAKLSVDLVLLAGLSFALVHVLERGSGWQADTLLLIQYVFVLASIGLVSQVYQLGGGTWQAALLWIGLTAPLMVHGRGRFLAQAWIVGMEATFGTVLWELADAHKQEFVALGLVYLAPMALLVTSTLGPVRARRPALAAAAARSGWLQLLAMASLAPLVLYQHGGHGDRSGLAAGLLAGAAASAVLWARASVLARGRADAVAPIRALLVLALVLSFGPFFVRWPDGGGWHRPLALVAAVSFVGLWGLVAWAGQKLASARIVEVATGLIAIRIIAVYIEVFGSLLDTGLGLLGGGILTLGLVWLWWRRRERLDAGAAVTGGTP